MSSSLWYSRRTDAANPTEPAANVPAGTSTDRPILKRRTRGHKHNPNSRWSQKHSLYQRGLDEVKDLYDKHTYRDPELGEVIALKESLLLDVEKGEVLRRGVAYQRHFDIFRRGSDWSRSRRPSASTL